ncbi:hypothetical protein [Nostoc sp.]|uniref:hypothetical protein n=1 Tax=Nostoc sp. TaxID=1180 RepID=UPI002FFA4396
MMAYHHHQYYRRCLRWAVTLLRRSKRTPASKLRGASLRVAMPQALRYAIGVALSQLTKQIHPLHPMKRQIMLDVQGCPEFM